ncbi:sulfite exporter TauE/SafE family protein [Sporosarcina sp. HYO08]|uniref:sulfite exporter TauE/SafE family protein n=1 Tax=Sporosarcina sp. HYO08 TaxID=1759557 RepID=UPI00079C0FCE|nr:sulfite exporter TauE/SafE family protein [Sporosarcina sp. HYO08]KXH86695.1 hypothetical protein AU377_14520 [Sporosarcina sp. HYO08]
MEIGIIFICIILIAAILQTSTGFGFSIMATPFLLLLFLPEEAIQINIILSLIISVFLIWKIYADLDVKLLKRLTIGSVFGVPFGLVIFMSMNIDTFKLVVSILLLLLTGLLIFNVKVKATPFKDFVVGGISGLLTTSIGMPGPPLLLYLSGTKTEKSKLRATTLAYYLAIYGLSLITQIIFNGTNQVIWRSSLYAIPIVLIGLLIGQIVFKWLNQRLFQLFTYVILSLSGLYLLFDVLQATYPIYPLLKTIFM